MKWLEKINKWICKKFGHSYNPIDEMMFVLKSSAENASELDLSITCNRCGETIRKGK